MGNILIKKKSDNSLFESINVRSNQVTGIDTNVITINPTNNFDPSTEYYIQIPDTAFLDQNGNFFSGINDSTTLDFSTSLVNFATYSVAGFKTI